MSETTYEKYERLVDLFKEDSDCRKPYLEAATRCILDRAYESGIGTEGGNLLETILAIVRVIDPLRADIELDEDVRHGRTIEGHKAEMSKELDALIEAEIARAPA